MDYFGDVVLGVQTAFSALNLLYCFVGVFLGTFMGVLPGIGPLAAVSMLFPITFYLEPTSALVMLAGVYYGSEYGGSISSILLNLPGTSSAAITCLDGYPMARQGRAGVALFTTAIASFAGAAVGISILTLFGPALASISLALRAPDYFAVMVLGLVAASTVAQGSPIKGIAMMVLGLMLGCVGADLNSGIHRFTLGFFELADGINLVAVAMGLFGVSELIASVNMPQGSVIGDKIRLWSMLPNRDDVRRSTLPVIRGTTIGGLIGALPGAGMTIASFMSYAVEKRVARDPSRFGRGAIEGIASPEAANNAAAQTAFIPTLTMGIPGTPTMALMLGAMMIHGIVPGPGMMRNHPDVFWGLVISFCIGNVILVVLNIPLIGMWVRILQIPYRLLYPAIICLICIGVYSINNSVFDVGLVFLLGLAGYGMRLLEFEPAPLLIGLVLGPLMEEYLRRAMLLSGGDFLVFFKQPVSAVLLLATAALLIWSVVQSFRRRGRSDAAIVETSNASERGLDHHQRDDPPQPFADST